jgi:hypothetical protein
MATQIDFDGRREPAQRGDLRVRNYEGGLGEIIFRCDRGHQLVRQPFVHHHHGRRIAAKATAGERIDLVDGKVHGKSPSFAFVTGKISYRSSGSIVQNTNADLSRS